MLCILEYSDVGSTQRGSLQVPLEPPLNEQGVEIGAESAQSKPLGKATSIVKLVTDRDCAFAVGADPDATNSMRFLAAGRETTLTVAAGSNLKIAVVATGSGAMSDSLGSLLKLIANPDRLDELNKRAAVLDSSATALRKMTEQNKKAQADAEAAALAAQAAKADADKAVADAALAAKKLADDRAAYDAKLKSDADLLISRNKALDNREIELNAASNDLATQAANLNASEADIKAREQALADEAAAVAALRADYEARVAKLKALV